MELQTEHRVFFGDASSLEPLAPESIHLVVTSPPYPMIEMWDSVFSQWDPQVPGALEKGEGGRAFECMHARLDAVWLETYRVLKPGGILCLNIGDAVRTINGDFRLFSNHSRALLGLFQAGFTGLPNILWRKPTNAPNKFMGSGMLPGGAYVTLEHEYILIARKGSKRIFATAEERGNRQRSAYFWEERNLWFSDVWMDLRGASQNLSGKETRSRSGAFPFELAYRLVNMYSVRGDTVLDPFLGTGTTMAAAMACGRNSVGWEIDPAFKTAIQGLLDRIPALGSGANQKRLENHLEFVQRYQDNGHRFRYVNIPYGFPVMTNQERQLVFYPPARAERSGEDLFRVSYLSEPEPLWRQLTIHA